MLNWIKKMSNNDLDPETRYASDEKLRVALRRRLNFLEQQIEVIKVRQNDSTGH